MKGEEVIQCAYVESTLTPAAYFASPCKFGPGGVTEVSTPSTPEKARRRSRHHAPSCP